MESNPGLIRSWNRPSFALVHLKHRNNTFFCAAYHIQSEVVNPTPLVPRLFLVGLETAGLASWPRVRWPDQQVETVAIYCAHLYPFDHSRIRNTHGRIIEIFYHWFQWEKICSRPFMVGLGYIRTIHGRIKQVWLYNAKTNIGKIQTHPYNQWPGKISWS